MGTKSVGGWGGLDKLKKDRARMLEINAIFNMYSTNSAQLVQEITNFGGSLHAYVPLARALAINKARILVTKNRLKRLKGGLTSGKV